MDEEAFEQTERAHPCSDPVRRKSGQERPRGENDGTESREITQTQQGDARRQTHNSMQEGYERV